MTTIIVPLYGYLSRVKKLWNITKLAKRRRLNITKQDEVGNNFIALDAAKGRLLYARKTPQSSSCLFINLNQVESCSIRKEYYGINAGDLKTMKLHQFLKAIYLNLVFKNKPGSLSLPLFDVRKDQPAHIKQVEAKAKKWESIVSNVLPIQRIARA